MRTVAITNQKGGSAKTTSAVCLAAALAELGQRVLLVDLDPQASASAWLGVTEPGRGLFDVFDGGKVHVAHLAHDTAVPNLAAVPASTWLMNAEKAVAGEVGAETLLRRAVAQLPPRWEWVFFDCPPSLGFLSLSALVACQDALLPVEAHTMALAGLASLRQTIDRVRERLNPELAILAILACRVDGRTNLSRDVVTRLREWGGPLMLDTVIRENVRLAEAPSFHKPITVYASGSTGAEDYRAAAAELLARTKRSRRR